VQRSLHLTLPRLRLHRLQAATPLPLPPHRLVAAAAVAVAVAAVATVATVAVALLHLLPPRLLEGAPPEETRDTPALSAETETRPEVAAEIAAAVATRRRRRREVPAEEGIAMARGVAVEIAIGTERETGHAEATVEAAKTEMRA
jgi:hypothetical protein